MFGRVKTADKFKISGFQGTVSFRASGALDANALSLINDGAGDVLCPCRHTPEGKSQLFEYQVQGLSPLINVNVTQREAQLLLNALWRFLTNVRTGVLCAENLAVQPENIYYNGSSFFLIYVPLIFAAKQNTKGNISAVITKLLGNVRDSSGMIAAFLNQSKHSNDITESLGAFLSSLPSVKPVYDTPPQKNPVSSQLPSEKFDKPPTEDEKAEYETTVLTGELNSFDEDETTVLNGVPLDDEDETTVLNGDPLDDEGETTVLNSVPSDDEGETTVLGSFNTGQEDETTVLGGVIIENEKVAETVFGGFSQSDNDDDTTLLSAELTDNDETSLLGQQVTGGSQRLAAVPSENMSLQITLIRTCNGQEIDLPPHCDIGSDPGSCTVTIPNRSISRRHATITAEGDAVYIIDNHSTNGTIADGITLRPNEKAEIFDGSFLTLGDESLQVRIR